MRGLFALKTYITTLMWILQIGFIIAGDGKTTIVVSSLEPDLLAEAAPKSDIRDEKSLASAGDEQLEDEKLRRKNTGCGLILLFGFNI